ncbi:transketolase [Naasia lichenicola]|uniref:Transketolase n=2 Tax=Naasia lichenicola TaxID=2565933 RepID=A0A4S4FKX3_9MICO|nr:transketolase [Naasia lichenicola]
MLGGNGFHVSRMTRNPARAGLSLSSTRRHEMDNDLMETEQRHSVAELEDLAFELRSKLLQLCGTYEGAVHIGGDLSSADIFTALFHYGLHVDPDDISNPTRDRFLLSKGHAAVCMYIAMSMRGFFSYEGIVDTYGLLDSAYGMHPCKVQLPGVEASTGSLGHGLPIAVGMALSARHRGETHRVVCLLGDGETGEGSVWEAAMAARSNELGNLVAFVDRNRQLMTSFDGERVVLEPYPDKWAAFGWNVIQVNGHDMGELVSAIDRFPATDSNRPTVIICDTVKGKGVDFMEANLAWHAGSLNPTDLARALAALESGRTHSSAAEKETV